MTFQFQSGVGCDVWLVAGQSNAVFFSHFYDADLDTTSAHIRQLPATGLPLIPAAEPLSHPDQGVSQPGIGISFALTFARLYALAVAPRQVILVPYAKQGTGLVNPADWAVGTPGGAFYEGAITQANIAMATNTRNIFAGILWHQGEEDVQNAVSGATYQNAFDAMIDGFRARITGASSSAFILGEMVPSWWSTHSGSAIAAVISDTPNRKSQCGYWAGATNGTDLSANGAPYDAVHYNAAGQRLNGAAAYTAYLNRSS